MTIDEIKSKYAMDSMPILRSSGKPMNGKKDGIVQKNGFFEVYVNGRLKGYAKSKEEAEKMLKNK